MSYRLLPLLACTLLLAACGPDPLQGRVVLSGSSTLAPLVTKAVEHWKRLHPRVDVRVEAIGSDAGLERLIRYADADIALVSRPLSDRDRAAAAAAGKDLIPIPLAWDAVCLVVGTSNTWAKSLTREQAMKAFTSASLWSDLDPSWPRVPLHRFVLGPQSGTSDVFSTALLSGDKSRLYSGSAVQSSEDDRILARGVAGVEGAIGFLGWTTVQEAELPLRVVALDGVEPTSATISTGTYGLPRQLWLVMDQGRTRPELRSLLLFLYDQYSEVLKGSSLIPLSTQERMRAEAVLKKLPS